VVNIKDTKYVKWFGRLLVLISLVFIARKLMEFGDEVLEYASTPLFYLNITVLSILYGITKIIHAMGWYQLLNINSNSVQNVSVYDAIIVFGKSHIAKYIPGNIFHYAGRHVLAKKFDLSDIFLIKTTILEITIVTSISVVFSLLSLRQIIYVSEDMLPGVGLKSIFIFIIILITISCAAYFFRSWISEQWNKLKWLSLIKSYLLYLCFYLVAFIIFLFITNTSIADPFSSTREILFLLGSYSVAWLAGFIVPGAPGGVGVREAVFLILLESYVGAAALLYVILTYRIVTVIGDFIQYLLTLILEYNISE
jgi:hypothetical protein